MKQPGSGDLLEGGKVNLRFHFKSGNLPMEAKLKLIA